MAFQYFFIFETSIFRNGYTTNELAEIRQKILRIQLYW
jgi:hypothetical protein